jgi:hypothetical protein
MHRGGILKEESGKTSPAGILLNKKGRVLSALPRAMNHSSFKKS